MQSSVYLEVVLNMRWSLIRVVSLKRDYCTSICIQHTFISHLLVDVLGH